MKNKQDIVAKIVLGFIYGFLIFLGCLPILFVIKEDINPGSLYTLGRFTFFLLIATYLSTFIIVLKNAYKKIEDDYFSLKFFFLIIAGYIIISMYD